MEELTFNDYLENKFFVDKDFKCYKYEEGGFSKKEHKYLKGSSKKWHTHVRSDLSKKWHTFVGGDFIEVSDSTKEGIFTEVKGKITKDTFQKINTHIKENFLIEVEKQFAEIKTKFEKCLSASIHKSHFIKAEKKTIKKILRGQNNIIVKYDAIELSPIITIKTDTISGIRKYLAKEYYFKDRYLYFIEDPGFKNDYKPYVMAEVFLRYFNYLKEFKLSNNNKQTFIDYLDPAEKEQLAQNLKDEFINDLQGNRNNKNTALFVFTLIENRSIKIGGINHAGLHKSIKKYFGVGIGNSQNFGKHINYKWELTSNYTEEQKSDFKKRISNCIALIST